MTTAIAPWQTDYEVPPRHGTAVSHSMDRVERYRLSRGNASIYPADLLPSGLLAQTELARQMCDHRYYEVVHRTLSHDFALFYLVFHDRDGTFRGAQPFFLVDQNILAGVQGRVADLAARIRTKYRRFMTLKTLMLGNPAGPGALGITRSHTAGNEESDRIWFAIALGEALALYSRRHKVRIVVFKDFPVESREAMSGLLDPTPGGADFIRIPSMPMTGLELSPYTSFEDYMTKTLSKATRKNLRRKFKATATEKIEMTVTQDISDCVDEVHRLYLQVYGRAGMKFEKLTPAYFLELDAPNAGPRAIFPLASRRKAACRLHHIGADAGRRWRSFRADRSVPRHGISARARLAHVLCHDARHSGMVHREQDRNLLFNAAQLRCETPFSPSPRAAGFIRAAHLADPESALQIRHAFRGTDAAR